MLNQCASLKLQWCAALRLRGAQTFRLREVGEVHFSCATACYQLVIFVIYARAHLE